MSNRELLKEAIADAKAVKEMAISNAKAALEEAFTPQLKSMLEKKLTEMDEEDDKEMEEAKMHDKEDSMEEAKHEDEHMTEEELNELLDELEEGEEKEHEMEEAKDHDEKMEEAEDEEMPEEEPKTDEEEKEEEEIDLEDMTEEDLKAFIEDVVDEMIAAGELEAGDEEMEAPEEEIEVTDEESEEEPMMEGKEEVNEIIGTAALIVGSLVALAGGAVAKAYKSFKDEQKQATEKETATLIAKGVDPKKAATQAVEKVAKEMSAKAPEYKGGKMSVAGVNEGETEEPMEEGHDEEVMEELKELDLSGGGDWGALADMLGVSIDAAKYLTAGFGFSLPAILAAIKIGGDKAVEGFKKLIGKKDEMEESLDALKAELNEVNLLNSKLLYTNKIFKAKNLTEAQKVKVLTTFDKAESVKEVKLVYETLSEGLVSTSTSKEAIKESKSFASKAVGTSPKKPVVETDGMVNRFQKLAGIK